jgi:hypothetical protein
MTLLEVQRRMANAIFQPLTRSDRMAWGADASKFMAAVTGSALSIRRPAELSGPMWQHGLNAVRQEGAQTL